MKDITISRLQGIGFVVTYRLKNQVETLNHQKDDLIKQHAHEIR